MTLHSEYKQAHLHIHIQMYGIYIICAIVYNEQKNLISPVQTVHTICTGKCVVVYMQQIIVYKLSSEFHPSVCYSKEQQSRPLSGWQV